MPSSKTLRPSGPIPRPPTSLTWHVQANIATSAPLAEYWRHNGEIVEVACSLPRIVGDEDVTGRHGRGGEVGDEMDDSACHRVHVAGRSGDGLRQHLSHGIKDSGRNVAGLPGGCAEAGAH